VLQRMQQEAHAGPLKQQHNAVSATPVPLVTSSSVLVHLT
jgi:hypothetical protein